MSTELQTSIAVVTGASRGIGREVARELAARGFLVVACARSEFDVHQAIAGAPGTFVAAGVDITLDTDVTALGELLASLDGSVDVLVNNAGAVFDDGESILDIPFSTLEQSWNTNAFGALRMVRAVWPHMSRSPQRDHERARIVNVSSGMGQLSEMGSRTSGYRTSKTLLNAFTRILSDELGEAALVASVCPGWVRTDMGGTSAPRSVQQGADTIVWLASGEAVDAQTGLFWRDRAVIAW